MHSLASCSLHQLRGPGVASTSSQPSPARMPRSPRLSPAGKAPERGPMRADYRRPHLSGTSVCAHSSSKANGASQFQAAAQSVASSASHVASSDSAPAPAPAPPSPSPPPPPPKRHLSQSGSLSRDDFFKFVQFFRQASPYIEGHRGRTFVIVLPGTVRDAFLHCAGKRTCHVFPPMERTMGYWGGPT